jgi:hypothetical protein
MAHHAAAPPTTSSRAMKASTIGSRLFDDSAATLPALAEVACAGSWRRVAAPSSSEGSGSSSLRACDV